MIDFKDGLVIDFSFILKNTKTIFMKISFLVIITALFILSCNDGGEANSTSGEAKRITADTAADMTITYPPGPANLSQDTSLSSKTVSLPNEFVNTAGSGGMMEVEMGRLAQTNGNSEDVKSYGKMLEKDHTDANNKLKDIAAGESIRIPSAMLPEHKQHVDHLQMLKGKEFDKAYMTMMIEDHIKDIAEFKTAAASNENEKIRAFAGSTLPVLNAHLAKAKSIGTKMK